MQSLWPCPNCRIEVPLKSRVCRECHHDIERDDIHNVRMCIILMFSSFIIGPALSFASIALGFVSWLVLFIMGAVYGAFVVVKI